MSLYSFIHSFSTCALILLRLKPFPAVPGQMFTPDWWPVHQCTGEYAMSKIQTINCFLGHVFANQDESLRALCAAVSHNSAASALFYSK